MATISNKLAVNESVTRAVNGYVQQDLIWNKVMPVVNVSKEKADIYEFGSEHFKIYDTARPLKSAIRTADSDDWQLTTVELQEHSFGFDLDAREIRNGSAQMNVLREYGRRAAKSLELQKEKIVADAVFSTTNITQNTTLSGVNQWSDVDSSDPIGDINTGIATVRASVGADANTLVLGDAVLKALANNDQVKEYLKYTGQLLTTQKLAEMFGFDNVLVGKSVYNNSGTMTDVWGKHALVAYIPNSPAREVPALGYTYSLQGAKKGLLYDANNSGTVKTVAATDTYINQIVWANAGYLIEDASA